MMVVVGVGECGGELLKELKTRWQAGAEVDMYLAGWRSRVFAGVLAVVR